MKYLSILFTFSVITSYAQVDLVNKSFPTEFSFIFSQVKLTLQPQELIANCKKLENDLSGIEKKHVYYLIKSDIYKTILDYEYDTYAPTVALNSFMLEQMKQKLSYNLKKYTLMSQWIFRSFLSDLNYRLQQGGQVNSIIEAKFLRPWFKNMSTKSPEEFNAITNKIALDVFNRVGIIAKTFSSNTTSQESRNTPKYFIFGQLPQKNEKTTTPDNAAQRLDEIIPTEDELNAEIDKIEQGLDKPWNPKSDALEVKKDRPSPSNNQEMSEQNWSPEQ